SGQTSIAFDTAATNSCASGCTEGTNITVPAVTGAGAGELFVNFVTTGTHGAGFGTPSKCYAYTGSGETGDCTMITTKNIAGIVANAATATNTPNANIITTNDTYQSNNSAYKYTSTASVTCTDFIPLLGAGCQ